MPRVSLITPFYNASESITHLIKSIQNLPNEIFDLLEWIIVDDHSNPSQKDYLYKILEGTSSTKIISLLENRGPSSARNEGIRHAKGDYVLFIDSDVEVEKSHFTFLLNKIIESLKVNEDFIFTAGIHEDISGNFPTRYKANYMNAIFSSFRGNERDCNFIYGSICGWNKKFSFFWPEKMRYAEDTYLAQTLVSQKAPITFLGNITIKHHKNYSYWELIKNDFIIPFYFCKAFFDSNAKTINRNGFSHTKFQQLFAILMANIMLFGMLGNIALTIILFPIWGLFNFTLLKEVTHKQSIFQKIGSVFFTFLDQIIMGTGIFFGILKFFPRRFRKDEA